MPKVSVVTGFYNRSKVLDRTISSILSQTLTDLELIVFDDASTDDTAERLRELAQRYADPRFSFYSHPVNTGFVTGLVQAIEKSTGDYIAIQGSGDVSLPKRLELQAEILDRDPDVAFVGGWYYNVQERLGTKRLRTPDATHMTFDDWISGNVFSHGEVMIRRSALESVGGYRTAFTFGQDYDLWLRLGQKYRAASVLEPIYMRYVQFDGVSYDPRKIVRQSAFTVAARKMAMMSAEDQVVALDELRTHGPLSVAPATDPSVQRMVVKSSIRLVIFGSPQGGVELARTSVQNPVLRFLLTSFGRLYATKLFAPIAYLIRRVLRIKG